MVFFRNGRIVQVTGTENYQPLGERLEQRRVITRAQLEEASTYMASFPGMRLGDALVELSCVTRGRVEAEVKAMMADSVQTLMSWGQGQFEFRVGVLWPGPGAPDAASDFVLEEGVEPQRIIVDIAERKGPDDTAPLHRRAPKSPEEQAEEEVQALLVSLNDKASSGSDPGEPGSVPRGAASSCRSRRSCSRCRGAGRWASSFCVTRASSTRTARSSTARAQGSRSSASSDRRSSGGPAVYEPGKTLFAREEVPVLEMVRTAGRPYAGLVRRTPEGAIVPATKGSSGVVAALMIPMTVLGSVTLILVCRTAVAGAPDARALVALARQVALSFENLALRDSLQRRGKSA